MKKLLGLFTMTSLAATACGTVTSSEDYISTPVDVPILSNGIFKVSENGSNGQFELSVKVSSEKIDSIEVVSTNDVNSNWNMALTEARKKLIGLGAEELNEIKKDDINTTEEEFPDEDIIKTVQKVINNDDSLVKFENLFTYDEIKKKLGEMIEGTYAVEWYDGQMGPSACPIYDNTFKTKIIPKDETETVRRIFINDESAMYINMGGWSMIRDGSLLPLLYNDLHESSNDIKLTYFAGESKGEIANCTTD